VIPLAAYENSMIKAHLPQFGEKDSDVVATDSGHSVLALHNQDLRPKIEGADLPTVPERNIYFTASGGV
jgi:hypothetical protein